MLYHFEVDLRLWRALWGVLFQGLKQAVQSDEDRVLVVVAGSADEQPVVVEPGAQLVAVFFAADVLEPLQSDN